MRLRIGCVVRFQMLVCLFSAAGLVGAAGLIGSARAQEAHFAVQDIVITPDLPRFSANLLYRGNGAELTRAGGSFEPILYRTRLSASEDAPDRVVAPAQAISQFNTLRTGALDGAEVDVLRIENGAFRLVRSAVVPPGGHQVSGWRALQRQEILTPESTRYHHAWKPWERPSVPQYFAVRAVDRSGRVSDLSDIVSVTVPDKPGGEAPQNTMSRLSKPVQEDARARLDAPRALRAQVNYAGLLTLEWAPVRGRVAGYVVYASDVPPDQHRGHFLALSGDGPGIEAGDMVLVRQKSYTASRHRMAAHRIWNTRETNVFRNMLVNGFSDERPGGLWELKPHEAGTPVTDAGETYLSLTFGPGDDAFVGSYNHAGTAQTWYPVLDPALTYRIEFWLRGRSTRPAVLRFDGPYSKRENGRIEPVPIPYGPTWTKFAVDVRVPRQLEGKEPGRIRLVFPGAGQADIDNFRIYPTDAPYLALEPEDVTRLRDFDIPVLRTHALIKSGRNTYDLDQLTNGPGGNSAVIGAATLGQLLQTFADVGADPWLQLDPHLGVEEWLGLVEYLAAPVDPAGSTPWAEKRARTGQAAPWTGAFDRILFELGNETWNNLFKPWTFDPMRDAATGKRRTGAEVYGLYQEYVLSVMRRSPHWDALGDKMVVTVGGWSGHPFGAKAAAASPETDLMTVATYIGGWDEGEGPVRPTPASFHSVLNAVNQTVLPRAKVHADEAARIARQRGRPLAVGTYEAGPGYVLNGLNNRKVTPEQAAQQELVMKSLAAGTATLDSFLAQAEMGYVEQSFFGYGAGDLWRSHATPAQGGQTFPAWDLLGLFNRVGTGDMLRTVALSVPAVDLEERARREAVRNAPQVAVYATRKGARLTVFVVSRRVPGYPDPHHDGRTSVRVDLPISRAGGLTRHRMTGGYAANNVARREVALTAEPVAVPSDPAVLDIPVLEPGETLVFVYEDIG